MAADTIAERPQGAMKDGGPNWQTKWGVGGVPFTSADAQSAASVTDAPTSGRVLVVDDILVSAEDAMSVTFKEETSGTVILGPLYLPDNSTLQLTPRGRLALKVANKKLQVQASGAGNIMVAVGYHSE